MLPGRRFWMGPQRLLWTRFTYRSWLLGALECFTAFLLDSLGAGYAEGMPAVQLVRHQPAAAQRLAPRGIPGHCKPKEFPCGPDGLCCPGGSCREVKGNWGCTGPVRSAPGQLPRGDVKGCFESIKKGCDKYLTPGYAKHKSCMMHGFSGCIRTELFPDAPQPGPQLSSNPPQRVAAVGGSEAPWHCAENCAQKWSQPGTFPEYQDCLDACQQEWPPRPFSGIPQGSTPVSDDHHVLEFPSCIGNNGKLVWWIGNDYFTFNIGIQNVWTENGVTLVAAHVPRQKDMEIPMNVVARYCEVAPSTVAARPSAVPGVPPPPAPGKNCPPIPSTCWRTSGPPDCKFACPPKKITTIPWPGEPATRQPVPGPSNLLARVRASLPNGWHAGELPRAADGEDCVLVENKSGTQAYVCCLSKPQAGGEAEIVCTPVKIKLPDPGSPAKPRPVGPRGISLARRRRRLARL